MKADFFEGGNYGQEQLIGLHSFHHSDYREKTAVKLHLSENLSMIVVIRLTNDTPRSQHLDPFHNHLPEVQKIALPKYTWRYTVAG